MSEDEKQGNIASRFVKHATEKGREMFSKLDVDKNTVESYGRRSKNQLRRVSSDLNFTDLLTKFPVVTVIFCLIVTAFFSWESGLVDCRQSLANPDGFCPIEGKSSMNVNGDLEVYLPQGSEVSALLNQVESVEGWTTNVMVIYVESEIVYVENKRLISLKPFPLRKIRPCVFEYIYFSRPDSILNGKCAYEYRKNFGVELAKETSVDADLVVPVPDSGNAAAIGYSQHEKINFDLGLIRNHYVGRTFIEPAQKIRSLGVRSVSYTHLTLPTTPYV